MLWSFTRTIFFLQLAFALPAQNSAPVIQNLTANADWTAVTLTLNFDVFDLENDPLEIQVQFSNDGGKTYALTGLVPISGDAGFPVMPGTGKAITCDLSGITGAGTSFQARVIALDLQPFDLQALVNEVDSNRLRADLEFIEGIRHPATGLAHLRAVRDSMERVFQSANLYTSMQNFQSGSYTAANVLGTSPGILAADTVVIVDAHYDSVSNAPGADDNGSGTVGVWEIARLLSRYPAKKSLRFIGFDLEEAGLLGSIRYVSAGIPANETIAGVFNFEMIGYYSEQPNSQSLPPGFNVFFPDATAMVAANQYRGDFITNVGKASLASVSNLFAASVDSFVPDLKIISVLEPNGLTLFDLRRSDHAPFWTANIPAIMITDGANFRNPCYHTPSDTLDEKLNFTFMSNVVKATLAAAAQLAEIQHGHAATVQFDGLVRVNALQRYCGVTAGAHPAGIRQPGLFFGDCPFRNLQVQLFSVNGQLLHFEQIDAPPRHDWYMLQTPDLPAGIYFIKIGAPEGSLSIKVALF